MTSSISYRVDADADMRYGRNKSANIQRHSDHFRRNILQITPRPRHDDDEIKTFIWSLSLCIFGCSALPFRVDFYIMPLTILLPCLTLEMAIVLWVWVCACVLNKFCSTPYKFILLHSSHFAHLNQQNEMNVKKKIYFHSVLLVFIRVLSAWCSIPTQIQYQKTLQKRR